MKSESITKEQLARLYGVTVRTVTNWMYASRRITFLKIGRVVRFNLEQVKAELEASGLVRPS
jgi:excisionase family DNA binding protein